MSTFGLQREKQKTKNFFSLILMKICLSFFFYICQMSQIAPWIKFRNRKQRLCTKRFVRFWWITSVYMVLMEICFSSNFGVMNFKIKLFFESYCFFVVLFRPIIPQVAQKFEQISVFSEFQWNILHFHYISNNALQQNLTCRI